VTHPFLTAETTHKLSCSFLKINFQLGNTFTATNFLRFSLIIFSSVGRVSNEVSLTTLTPPSTMLVFTFPSIIRSLSSILRQVSRSIGLVMLPCVELTPSSPPAESVIVLVATSGIICDEAMGPRPGRLRLSWVLSSSSSESESSLLCGAGSRSLRLVPLAVDPLFPPDRLLLATVTIAFYFFYEGLRCFGPSLCFRSLYGLNPSVQHLHYPTQPRHVLPPPAPVSC
jgi:hypothetical protein